MDKKNALMAIGVSDEPESWYLEGAGDLPFVQGNWTESIMGDGSVTWTGDTVSIDTGTSSSNVVDIQSDNYGYVYKSRTNLRATVNNSSSEFFPVYVRNLAGDRYARVKYDHTNKIMSLEVASGSTPVPGVALSWPEIVSGIEYRFECDMRIVNDRVIAQINQYQGSTVVRSETFSVSLVDLFGDNMSLVMRAEGSTDVVFDDLYTDGISTKEVRYGSGYLPFNNGDWVTYRGSATYTTDKIILPRVYPDLTISKLSNYRITNGVRLRYFIKMTSVDDLDRFVFRGVYDGDNMGDEFIQIYSRDQNGTFTCDIRQGGISNDDIIISDADVKDNTYIEILITFSGTDVTVTLNIYDDLMALINTGVRTVPWTAGFWDLYPTVTGYQTVKDILEFEATKI